MQLFNTLISPIEYLFEKLFEVLYLFTNNYGITLILLSVAVSTILLPLYKIADIWRNKEKTHQQIMNADISSIKSHYKGQERYYALKTAYKIYKYNPFYSLRVSAGFLIQIPFFFAAYHFLSHYQGYKGISFGIISDLGQADGIFFGIHTLPILMTLINIIAGLVYTKELNKNETLQLLGLSLFFLIILYKSPSALVLYWTMNNMYSLIKYSIENKTNPKILFSHVKTITQKGLLHPYVSDGIKIILLTSIYLVIMYATHHWRSAVSAVHSIEIAIALLFLCIFMMQAKLLALSLSQHEKKSPFLILSIPIVSIALMFGLLLLKVNSIDTDTIQFFIFKLTGNRLRQLTTFFQLFSVAILYMKFRKISPPIYRSYNASQKIPMRFFMVNILASVLIIVIASPITTYIASPNDFGGDIYFLLISVCVLGFSLIVITYILGRLLRKIQYTVYYRALIFFVLVAIVSICYGFIVNLNLGAIHGLRFANEDVLLYLHKSFFLLEPLIFITLYVVLLQYFPKIQYQLTMLIGFTTIFILTNTVWQLTKQAELFSVNDFQEKESRNFNNPSATLPPYHNSLLSFSKEKNILYIILDAFSGNLFADLLQKKEDLLEKMDGFVWYKNTVSISPFTFQSNAAMIGGYQYSPKNIEQFNRHIDESVYHAWAYWPKTMPSYNISFIPPGTYSSFDINARLHKNFPNVYSVIPKDDYYNYWSSLYPNAPLTIAVQDSKYSLHIPKLINASIFKIMPLHFKQRLYQDDTWRVFITGTKNTRGYDAYKAIARFIDTFLILDSFRTSSNTSNSKPTLKILWSSVHYPFFLNETCDGVAKNQIIDESFDVWEDTSAQRHMYCALDSIAKWTYWMKEVDIYDNTKIIIASDHGSTYAIKNKDGKYTKDDGIFALLMIKDFKSRGSMETSEQLMSNVDIPAIISSAEPLMQFPNMPKDPIIHKRKNIPMIYYHTQYTPKNTTTTIPFDYTITIEKNVYDRDTWQYSNR